MDYTREISPGIHWVGGNDRRLALFENMFPLPQGVAYNSYLILDDKVALMDTVDAAITRQFFENMDRLLAGRAIDYLVVNHMEPDHCANIEELARRYPEMKIVGNQKTFQMIRQFYDFSLDDRCIEVREGDSLPLGAHTLKFYFAPMVHWPEVMLALRRVRASSLRRTPLAPSVRMTGIFSATKRILSGFTFRKRAGIMPILWANTARRCRPLSKSLAALM